MIEVLAVMGRPATTAELARILGVGRRRLVALLDRLAAAGSVAEAELDASRRGWCVVVDAAPPPSRRRLLHARIASALAQGLGSMQDPRAIEVVHHFRLAEKASEVLRFALPAARYLKATFQNHAALHLYRVALDALPRRRRRKRLDVALEIAELQGRIGEPEEGIATLRRLLARSPELSRRARLRVRLRLATLHSRLGDFHRADALFREMLPEANSPRGGLPDEEALAFLNEYAAVKVFTGDYDESLRCCAEGLRLAGGKRSAAVREVALNLHATRANVAMRRFRHDAAIADFQRALEIAESIGSSVNQAVILNNLGIAFLQCDRYDDAVRRLREAGRACELLEEGPSVVSIHGNLAVLHAKRGESDAMEDELALLRRLGRAGMGKRLELFVEHVHGLCAIYRGRYREADGRLETAIDLARQVGDRHVLFFDEVYRAEALLFQGKYAAARRELERQADETERGAAAKMACSRLALLHSLTGSARLIEETLERRRRVGVDPNPFLDAWDDFFIGWAQSVAGSHDEAEVHLRAAEAFFSAKGLSPALALCRWAAAEARLLRGDRDGARDALELGPDCDNDLIAALRPLLKARLLFHGGDDIGTPAEVSDLLASAGAAMVRNPLPEWEARLAALRASLEGGSRAARAEVARRREVLARELPEEARRDYLEHPHWRTWAPASPRRRQRAASAGSPRPHSGDARGGPDSSPTAPLPGSISPSWGSRLVARSAPMRRLREMLDGLRRRELPVLIVGETGSGKELIARTIHEESPRRSGPFTVVDLAALPPSLLEVELFGARAGAFTDLRRERQGLLPAAGGGTVLLDEVGALTLEVQARLLRVLAEGTVRPLGAEQEVEVDIRFLFSTARDLDREVREGRFRRDLFHRLDVLEIEVPPLRRRPEDLPELVRALLHEERAGDDRTPPPSVTADAIALLAEQPWPGNVRELGNFLSRLRIETPGPIDAGAVRSLLAAPESTTVFPRGLFARERLPALKRRLEKDYLEYHVGRLAGDTRALCEFLRLKPRQLYRVLGRAGISLRRARARARSGGA